MDAFFGETVIRIIFSDVGGHTEEIYIERFGCGST